VTPLDALLIINALSTLKVPEGGRHCINGDVPPLVSAEGVSTTRYVDVNKDGYLDQSDALRVLNAVNGR
jgi:hypothetical protein